MDDLEHYMEATGRLSRRVSELEASMNAAEALYGFCGWLTTQDEETVMSAHNDSAVICDRIKTFCEVNKLPEPREGWEKKLTHPQQITEFIKG